MEISKKEMRTIMDLIDFWNDHRSFGDIVPDEAEVSALERKISKRSEK